MSKPGNNSVSYSGFLIPATGALYVNKPEWFNYETTIQSFRDYIKQNPLIAGKKYLMILDNAPWHRKAIRLIWKEKLEEYQDIRESMTYINLPPYSPDLNPIEQVWRITRREKTHNRYFPSLNVIAEVLDDFFGTFVNGSVRLMSLCSFKCFA
jgi:transposase-like protein